MTTPASSPDAVAPRSLARPESASQPLTASEHSAEQERLARGLTRLRSLALLMDDRFELPVVGVRFGLDPLIGLIPAWGDWITWAVSSFILMEGVRLGMPMGKLLAMAFHVSMDLITGYVPGIGDVIDVVYKANRRNVNIILSHFGAEPISFKKDANTRALAPNATTTSTSATCQNDAIIVLPDDALDRRTSSLSRWLVGGVLLTALAALAAVPLLLIWWLLSR